MFDLAKEIWQTMRSNKLRTILTGISVAWGIFMLILLLAIANGVVKENMAWAESNDPMRISIWGGNTRLPYKGLKEGRQITLRERYSDDIVQSDPDHISAVSGYKMLMGTISTQRDYLKKSYCQGVYPQYFNQKYKIIAGRFINEADIKQSRKSMLLHKSNASLLFGKEDAGVGKNVQVGNFTFTVVGIYDHDWDTYPMVPYTTAVALTGYDDNMGTFNVHLKNIADTADSQGASRNAVKALGKSAKFDPTDQSAVYVFDRYKSYINQQTSNSILNYVMWTIGLLTLLTGIVGVSNIMFVSVKERTHEIGVRRAIGARPRHIITQVLLESISLTTIFGYIGIVLGTIAVEIVRYTFANSDFSLNPQVDLSIALQVTVALIIAGALAGLFPALRALKVNPVEALRDE